MMDDELRLDGNAVAGSLREIFSFEVITAEYACEGCGRTDRIVAAMVYEVRELGTIICCPSCDNALVRLAHNRGRYWIDLRGIRYLQSEDVAG
jgi:hypothetical protein